MRSRFRNIVGATLAVALAFPMITPSNGQRLFMLKCNQR